MTKDQPPKTESKPEKPPKGEPVGDDPGQTLKRSLDDTLAERKNR